VKAFATACLAAALLASGAAAESTSTAAKKCPRGQARVTIAGKSACRAVAQVVPRRRVGNGLAPALRRGLEPTWGETRDGPKTLTEVVGAETARAIEEKITSALEAFERQGRGRYLAAAHAGLGCSSSQVLPETSSAYKQAVEGGGEFSVAMTTGSGGANMTMSVTVPPKSGRAVRITVNLSLCSGERLEVKECPTNQGVVEGTDNTSGEIKIDQLEDGAVVESSSTKIAITTKLRGEVETDAKLKFLEIDRTESYATSVGYGRWLGAATNTTLRRRATLSMPSGSVVSGTGSLDVRQSFSGVLSFLVNQAAARAAAINAAQRASDEAWAKFTDEAIKKYRERESAWQKAGTCAELEFTPKSNTLRVRLGQQGLFTGSVKAKRGGNAEGRWKVTARTRLGVRPAGNPGATQPWRYRVDGEGKVSVTFKVTSKAGVASGTWEQGGAALPRQITGTFSGSSGDTTALLSWSGTITFVRDDSHSAVGRAGYAVERASFTSTYAINEPFTGCRGQGTATASLGRQGAGNHLLLNRRAVGGRHGYEISTSLQGTTMTSMPVVCPYGTVTQPLSASAVLITFPATLVVDARTWRFSGTNTIPGGGGAATTMTWDLRGSN
jgi:hypothetical protein